MILETLRLHPFAGISDRTVTLRSGLNVVIGPNEAGKSTLVHALKKALFTTTHLSPARFKAEMQSSLPVTGGDTVRVSLGFRCEGGGYLLDKCWSPGRGSSSRLCLPGSGELTSPDQVDASLRDLLRFTEGTYANVLITGQSSLSGTIAELREDPVRTTSDLADLLRRAIFRSDGVPADRLRELSGERVHRYFSRWDRGQNRPEGGRDIDHPWKQEVGVILEAYYAFRTAERAFRRAEEVNRKVDEYSIRIRSLQEETAELHAYIASYAPHYADARHRTDIQSRLQLLSRELPEMRETSKSWPLAEDQAARLRAEIPVLLEQFKSLREERKQTEEYTARQGLLETYREARHGQERLEEEGARLADLRPVDDGTIAAMRQAEARVNSLRIRLDSQKLALRILANASFTADLRSATGVKTIAVEPGKEFEETVAGHIEITHADWVLKLQPAGDDLRKLTEELEKESGALVRKKQELGIASVEEAVSMARSYATQLSAVERARAALAGTTRGEPFESLAGRVNALPPVGPGRAAAALDELMEGVRSEGGRKRTELGVIENQCEGWRRRYTDPEKLFTMLIEKTQDEQRLGADLAALNPLPEGTGGVEEFLKEYDLKRGRVVAAERELSTLERERAVVEKEAPQESREELEERLRDSRQKYAAALAHGSAFSRVHDELERLLKDMDRDTYGPLQSRFEALVGRLTLDRHSGLEMEGPLPVRVKGPGRPMDLGMLSKGTIDVLALAVRLGMAEHYLDGGGGFVLLDDPLVNLDPARRAAAADCLREFARERQTIILTCHPSHASLLGGNTISL